MRRAELIDELERLGTRPVPLPDPRRVDALEDRLYREFLAAPSPSARASVLAARRRRRQVLVAGIGLAAAASAAVIVLHRGGESGFQLDAATGAMVLLPGGQSRVAQAGEEIPSGGLIQTGPSGSVTIDGTNIGPAQMVLLGDAGLTLLPAPDVDTAPPTTAVVEPAPSATEAPATAPATAAPRPTAAAVPVAPAAAIAPLPELALTVGEDNGGVHLAWTPTESESFASYVVARGPADTKQLVDIAELTDRQITSFTDPAALHGVELLYEIVALGTDGRPVAVSEIVSVTLQDAPVSVPGEVPPTTDSTGGALSIPSTTQPDTTAPDSTVPDTTGPDMTGPDSSAPDTTGSDTTPPDSTVPDTSGPPSTDAPSDSDPPPSEPPTAVPPTSP